MAEMTLDQEKDMLAGMWGGHGKKEGREVKVSDNRGKIQIYIRAGTSNVPVFNGFDLDIETAADLHKKLGAAIKRAKK